MNIERLDDLVVQRLMFHARQIKTLPGYTELVAQKRKEREAAIAQIEEAITSIPVEQQRLRTQMRKTEKESVRDMLLADIENMELEKEKLQRAKAALEAEMRHGLGSLDEELQTLEEQWGEYPLQWRIALLNFLIAEVSLDLMSPRWVRIRITWANEWGCEQMYMYREEEHAPRWTEPELDYLRDNLLMASKAELMERLDTRTWQSIRNRAYVMGLIRNRYEHDERYTPQNAHLCVRDFQFMWEKGLPTTCDSLGHPTFTITTWEAVTIQK